MSAMAATMMQNPDMLEMMLNQAAVMMGKDPSQLRPLLGCLKGLLKVYSFCNFFLAGWRKYVTGSVVVLLIAYYFELI
jgi:hypothetical protein